MKLYKGAREPDACKVTVTDGEGKTYPLDPRLDLKQHSYDGSYEFGYRGSGPSQLSLAIVADALGDDKSALARYSEFRDLVISRIIGDSWEMTEPFVREFC